MGRKASTHERRQGERAKRYTPRPHPEVTAALEAAGLKAETVYRLRRWDRGNLDLDRLAGALHALTVNGWRVASAAGPAIRYPAAPRPASKGGVSASTHARRADDLRAQHDRARGLSYVFDRSPDAIETHLSRYRRAMAAMAADPLARLSAAPGAPVLSKAELGALSSFVSAFGKFHAAIGNASMTVSAGDGVPMTDDARAAAQREYCDMCARIVRLAGPGALSACQDLASGAPFLPPRWRLQEAAHAIDATLPPLPRVSLTPDERAGAEGAKS